MTNEPNRCPRCGSTLPADAPGGNCPVCLMGLAVLPAASEGPGPMSPTASSRFGDYELGPSIGTGGMGMVYRARQISLNRTVALKLIRAGGFASERDQARFQTEAEAAASLDHPHIVPVYDFGEWEGWRYLSMRLVEGPTLAEEMGHCQADVRAGVTLLAQVARAVHFAHQRGILHRDLKPSNILIDANGQPQVTDFGLAKRLDATTGVTLTGQAVGTPAYMAPEQAKGGGKGLSTAVDVYSLGVLLYEMLAGRVPFPGTATLDILRQVVETEPQRPSALRPKVDIELETVCLRCLDKDPKRRYGSAEALAEELERWLRHEPILARRSGVWSRSVKWARRHPAPTVVAALLIAGSALSTWLAWSEARARRDAESAGQQAQQIADFLQSMLAGVGPSVALGRDTTLLREVLDATAGRLGASLTNQPGVEAELRSTVGGVYRALGLYDQADAMFKAALALRTRLYGTEHPQVAASHLDLAGVLLDRGKLDEAESLVRKALSMRRRFLGNAHPDVATSLNNLAAVLMARSKLAEAESALRESLVISRAHFGDTHPEVATSLNNLGSVLREQGRLPEAEEAVRQALAMRKSLLPSQHPDLSNSINTLAGLLLTQGKLGEAETLFRDDLASRKKLLGNEHPEVANALNNLAGVRFHQGAIEDAETLHREALAMQRKLLGDEHPDIAGSLNNLGLVLREQGKPSEAEGLFVEALQMTRRLLGSPHSKVAASINNVALALADQKRFAEAEPLFREALAMYRGLFGEDHPDVANALNSLASVLTEQAKLAEAEPLFREALAIQQRGLGQEHPAVANSLNNLGFLLQDLGKLSDAEQVHREALAMRIKLLGAGHPDTWVSMNNLASVLQEQRQFDQAEKLYRDVLAERRRRLNDAHPHLALSLDNLAALLAKQDRLDEAESLSREALATYRKAYGATNRMVAPALRQLAGVLRKQGNTEESDRLEAEAAAIAPPQPQPAAAPGSTTK